MSDGVPSCDPSMRERASCASPGLLGWTAVGFGTLAASFWAFWGTIEAFHEGWCKPSLWMRLLQLLATSVCDCQSAAAAGESSNLSPPPKHRLTSLNATTPRRCCLSNPTQAW